MPARIQATIWEPRTGCGPFYADNATAIKTARMAHLDSLGLSIRGRSVLDVRCGVGLLAGFFFGNEFEVTCVGLLLRDAGFEFVWEPKTVPNHEDFDFEPLNDLAWERVGHPLRRVFVASRTELLIPTLEPL